MNVGRKNRLNVVMGRTPGANDARWIGGSSCCRENGRGECGSELNSKRMRFYLPQAPNPIRLPSNARKRRAAMKWRATGVSSPRQWRASRESGHLCSTPCSDEHDATLARRDKSMVDGQIVVALAEAFLLGACHSAPSSPAASNRSTSSHRAAGSARKSRLARSSATAQIPGVEATAHRPCGRVQTPSGSPWRHPSSRGAAGSRR